MVKLSDLNKMFATETQAKNFLMLQRWGQTGVRCPRCDNDKVYTLKAKPYHWQCQHPKCGDAKDGKPNRGYRFSVITGTIFENTKYPLRTWFTVAFLMLQSKKGMSALQIKRTVFHDKASYETVWYMCTRIRAALLDPEFEHLMGIVEVDETYIGGKKGNKHKSKRGPERGPQGKIPVLGAISRKGNVIAEMVQNVDSLTCEKFIKRVIDRKNLKLVATDESKGVHQFETITATRTTPWITRRKNTCAGSFIRRSIEKFLVTSETRDHGQLSSRVREISAAVFERVCFQIQQSEKSGHLP